MNKILIIGSGNVATALAADLSLKGNRICIYKTSNQKSENYEFIKKNKTIIITDSEKSMEASVEVATENLEEAFKFEPNVIFIATQTTYHEEIITKLSKYTNSGQIVIIVPGYLSSCYFLKYCNKDQLPTVVECESSPIDCRVTAPGVVNVFFRNVRNPIGIYPEKNKKDTEETLKNLNLNFITISSVVEAALHNPNLIVHTIGAVMSIPRIEYSNGEYSMYKEVFTKSIYNLIERLDEEKNNVFVKLGIKPMSYFDACCYRNSEDITVDSRSVFEDYAKNSAPGGPNVSDSRYITEDVPQGLVLLESLGDFLGVKTDVTTALINIANACLLRNFRENGRTINRLGKENLDKLLINK